jgi:hypothetical protein
MGSVFQKSGCEPTNVGKNHTFLTAPNSTSSHSVPARLAHLTYKNSDSFPIPEQYTYFTGDKEEAINILNLYVR